VEAVRNLDTKTADGGGTGDVLGHLVAGVAFHFQRVERMEVEVLDGGDTVTVGIPIVALGARDTPSEAQVVIDGSSAVGQILANSIDSGEPHGGVAFDTLVKVWGVLFTIRDALEFAGVEVGEVKALVTSHTLVGPKFVGVAVQDGVG